jgi:hypothetical protein
LAKVTISRRKHPVSVATVNRELACLKRMFNVAHKGLIVLKGGVPKDKPLEVVSLERERNERDRVLSAEEFAHLCEAAENWLSPCSWWHTTPACEKTKSGHCDGIKWT